MCEVCAVFGIGRHWTDAGNLADAALPAASIARYRTERRRRVQLINRLLRPTGVVVTDWDGESFWVGRHDGRGERATDLAQIWPIAERLAAAPIDPLADDFLPA